MRLGLVSRGRSLPLFEVFSVDWSRMGQLFRGAACVVAVDSHHSVSEVEAAKKLRK